MKRLFRGIALAKSGIEFPDIASAHPGYDSRVMAGLVPAIHALGCRTKTWMPAKIKSGAGMTWRVQSSLK